MDTKNVHDAIAASVESVIADNRDADPGKVAQLESHLTTVHMIVDQIADNATVRAAEGT